MFSETIKNLLFWCSETQISDLQVKPILKYWQSLKFFHKHTQNYPLSILNKQKLLFLLNSFKPSDFCSSSTFLHRYTQDQFSFVPILFGKRKKSKIGKKKILNKFRHFFTNTLTQSCWDFFFPFARTRTALGARCVRVWV